MTLMNSKPKVYLAGSIAGGRDFENNLILISDLLEDLGYKIVTKPNVVHNQKRFNNASTLSTRRTIMKRDKKWLREADFVIQEVSQYSHGVGYEHAYAESQNKPILILRHLSLKGHRQSAFLDGTDYKKFMFYFYDETNIKSILEKFLKKYESA